MKLDITRFFFEAAPMDYSASVAEIGASAGADTWRAAWSDVELNALCLQWVAGDMREADLDANSTDEDWTRYTESAERGQCSSNIFRSGASVFFYIGV